MLKWAVIEMKDWLQNTVATKQHNLRVMQLLNSVCVCLKSGGGGGRVGGDFALLQRLPTPMCPNLACTMI